MKLSKQLEYSPDRRILQSGQLSQPLYAAFIYLTIPSRLILSSPLLLIAHYGRGTALSQIALHSSDTT
jgi:hypothetical protein